MPGVLKNINYDDPLVRYKGERVLEIVKKFTKVRGDINIDTAIDIFYTFFLPFPRLIQLSEVSKANETNYIIVRELMKSEDVRKVRVYTIANSGRSTIIGASFIEHLLQELNSMGEGSGNDQGQSSENNQESEGDTQQQSRNEKLKEAIRNATKKLENEIEHINRFETLAQGLQAGTGSILEIEDSSADIIRMARNTDVRKLLELLQWIPDWSPKSKRKTYKSPRGELEGYEEGTDLERLVPSELAYPQEYFYTRLAEGELLIYNKVLPLSQGPIYVLLDKSGSMDGEKIKWAKATALALLMRARKEHRLYLLRFFDSTPYSLIKISKKGKPSEITRLIDYLARIKSGGGTDITRSIVVACQDVKYSKAKGIGDIIIITDGEDRIAENVIKKCLRELNLNLITVMVMGDNPDLKRISYKYFKVTRLSTGELLEIVEF